MKSKYTVTFRMEKREKSASFLMLGTFFLGPFYLLFARMWGPALIYFMIPFGILVFGLLLPALVYLFFPTVILLPFFSQTLVRRYYLTHGWDEVEDGKVVCRGRNGASNALERAQIALLEAQTEAIKKGGIPSVPEKAKILKPVADKEGEIPTYYL